MLKRTLFLVVAMMFLLLLPSPAWAWNKPGHMVTAAIAYSELQQNAPQATVRGVVSILKQHPDFDGNWSSQLSRISDSEIDPDQVLFMLAARWPDDIRRTPGLDHPKWHYINFPYKPADQPASVTVKEPDLDDNIINGFEENLNIIRSSADDSEKAIALCWLFHLIGDVHQPLHTVALFTTDYPNGDRGGTRFYVRARQGGGAISLHEFWDDLILGSEQVRSVRNQATELRLNPSYRRSALSELSETQFDNWAKPESFEIAKEVAYRNGTLKGSPDQENAQVLPADYASSVKEVGERRAVLAGYRIADLLQQNF